MILTGLILGAALGFVMQRGRFCVTGMIRDIFTLRSWRGFTALLIVIAVHALGLALLTSTGVIAPSVKPFAPIGVVLGSFVFGLGIVLAGGCASGTWYRSAEGLVGSWIALLMYGLSAAAMKYGALSWLQKGLTSYRWNVTTLPALLNVSTWVFAVPLALGAAAAAIHYLRDEASRPAVAQLTPRKSGIAHLLTERPWHFYPTAVIIGVLGTLAWPLSTASGRNAGLGITTPSADLTTFLTTGNTARINWGVMLVLGLLLGAFAAAKASGEFRVRVPSGTQAVRSVVGGVLMGVGASLAGGCTVGNGMVETALFSFQGWVALAAIAAGVWVAAKLWLKPQGAQGSLVASPGPSSLSDATPTQRTTENLLGGIQVAPAGLLGGSGGVAVLSDKRAPAAQTPRALGSTPEGRRQFTLDTLGAVCPFPLIEAKTAMQQLRDGDELVINFDCTQATDAIPRWAAEDGHAVRKFEATGDAAGWTITLEKAGAAQ
ncbi:YeeE/YedE thiosulfate transporter family protein [Corynebacterium heidelbergense]|uniref:UPF0033 domain-containing protein n=1 Tax=Corynebacterium heidelbergense TaxID=2055947 RepID=A0A364V6G0_9CORY|nr:YeeE/YedE thiosulfate transporter family protein [Corynebacterium heidelbergense]RAV32232.1 hypothetical protein DLJ54_04350 [Corynebacterium heidelbergense]